MELHAAADALPKHDVLQLARAESMREQADAAIKEARPILRANGGDLARPDR
jgi:hypothetical protein